MKRNLQTLFLASALAAGGVYGLVAPSEAHAGANDCTTKKFATKQVEQACKSGGRKAAKKMMKDVVKKAKAAGNKIKCKSCHEDVKSYKLKDNAVDDLKKLL